MDEKTLTILEFPKILERLAGYCGFSASQEKARALRPVDDLHEARHRQAVTAEAVQFLVTHSDLTIGGARDVRGPVDLAAHGGVLTAAELLDIKQTLTAARTLTRSFERLAAQYPVLYEIVQQMNPPAGLIDAITRTISERGEILDSASEKLASVRREQRIVYERLMSKLQRMVGDPRNAPYLQDALITQRDGRYVIPLRAEFKGRIRSIVHDQSQSGATLFVEPLTVVDQNNQYRELQLAERDEERRILAELSRQVMMHGEAILHTVDVIANLDLALACGKYAEDLAAVEPKLHSLKNQRGASPHPMTPYPDSGRGGEAPPPSPILWGRGAGGDEGLHPGSIIRLYQARHPLLDPETVVAIDVELDPTTYALIITGPNTGGKTVALKTVGLLAVMAQAGLHIPAHTGSEISAFGSIYADIGDEQSIEQSLSTFSGHITNIIRILEQADRRSLVILDELGAGTDPQEGSALARAILSHLLERGITTLVTTHHPELKAYAHATPGVVNASVEFDLETLRPTYHLTIGLPGRSNALAIAERLGLPKAIIVDARSEINPEDLRAEDLLDEIHKQRDLSRQARAAAETARQEAELMRRGLLDRLEKIEDERRKLLDEARREAQEQVSELQDEIAQARKALTRARQPVEALKEIEEIADELEETVEAPVERQELALGPALEKLEGERRRALRVGDKVRLRSLGALGVITALSEDDAEVSIGMLRVRSRLSDLERPAPAPDPRFTIAGSTDAAKGGKELLQASSTGGKGGRQASDSISADGRGSKRGKGKPSGSLAETGESERTGRIPGERGSDERPGGISLAASPGMELDLRGQRADDALDQMERYLDAAYLAGMPFVRIIHGKGTGKLREAVRQALHNHPHVRRYEGGGEKEGGEGVTVAHLAT